MKPSKLLPFKKRPLTTAIQAVCYSMLGALPLANAGLVDGRIVDGTGTITQSGLTTTVDQASQRLGMTAQSLNLTVNELLKFNQPNTSAIALLRILGNDGSTIAGRIDANGKVILANPNGIFFTSTATLNVGSIVASGLDISSADFMNGRYIFNEIAGTHGTVINSGTINASLGGSVALIGKRVENNGLITATLGSVTLAAGKQAVLTFDQGGLLGVRVSKEILQSELGVDPAVLNSGTINASGGKVLLTASVSKDIFSQAVNTQGLQQATSVVVNDDGSFSLGGGADVLNTGSIDTSTTAANQNVGRIVLIGENVTSSGVLRADAATGNGGEIELHSSDTTLLTQNSVTSARAETSGNGGLVKVLGDKVGLFDQATLDVSGSHGGGQALIGGDREGKNTAIRNANYIYLSEQSQVKADSLNTGNGGKIITFAKDTARIYGNLSARGGVNGGNGGFIETSGLRGFEILNAPDAGASNGVAGLWLIDPFDLTISDSGQTQVTSGPTFSPTGSGAILNVGTIRSALNTNDVTINTGTSGSENGDITLTSTADINYNERESRTLTLNAARDITFEAGSSIIDGNGTTDTTNNNYADRLNVSLNAGRAVLLEAGSSITTQGGNFTVGSTTSRVASFTNNGTVNTSGTGNQNGGNISIYTTGNVSSTALTADGGAAIRTVNNQGAPGLNGGDVTVDAGGSVLLGSISSRGSNGNFDNGENPGGENGGVGGTVNIVTTSASGITVNGTINTSGGNGSGDNDTGNGADPGSGGNAGSVTVQANNGAVALGAIIANGGTAIGADGTPVGGNGALVSVAGISIQLGGDIQANGGLAESISATAVTPGDGANITLTGPVTLGANVVLAASGATRGDISFSNTLNGPFDLGLTGRDVTFRGAVGNTGRLGTFTINATGDVTAATDATVPVPNAITANSISVAQSSSFTSGAINTSSASAAGGTVAITSSGAINTGAITTTGPLNGGAVTVSQSGSFTSGAINTSSTTAAGGAVNLTSSGAVNVGDIITAGSTASGTANGGAITVQAAEITLNGNIDARNAGGTTSQTANLTLTSPGSVFINYVNNITSPINLMVSGAAGTHILNAANRANSWVITGNNSGSLNTGITFSGFETLNGNADNDTFTFNVDSSVITTLINAGGQVSPTGDTVGFATGVTAVNVFVDRFTGIEGITGTNDGSAGNGLGNSSTLTGANTPNNNWDITGTNSGTYNTNLIFSGFNNLTGGNAGNTFTLAPNPTLPGSGVITGTITGGGTAGNTLVARQGVANIWSFTTTTSGSLTQTGQPTAYVNNFTNIQNFTGGGTGSDWADLSSSTNLNVNAGSYTGFAGIIGNLTSTLTGWDGQTNNWNIRAVTDQNNATTDGLNDGVVTGGSFPQLRFVNFGTLTGGDSVDNFVIDASGSMNGTINGGNGANTLTAKDIRNTWSINSTVSTLSYGGLGTTQPLAATTTFNAIQTLTGGSDVDTITVTGSTGADIDTAGGVTNSVTINAGVVLTGTINGGTGADTITVNGTLTGSLNAGAGIDRVVLGAAGNVTGVIDGGADADTLDITARPATTVQIGTTQTSYLDVNQVETINANPSAANTLRGDAGNNNWLINSANNGTVAGITFTGFQNLTGGDGLDTFTVNASIANIDTGNGATNSVTVNSAGIVTGTIAGGTGMDTITLLAGSTVTTIDGGAGADEFNISGNAGTINGGIGDDTFSISGTAGTLNGDAGDDRFTVNQGGLVATIDGGTHVTIVGDTLTLPPRADISIGSGLGVGVTNIEGVVSTNGRLRARNGFNTTWDITGTDIGIAADDGNQSLSFNGFSFLYGSDGNDVFNITGNGSLSGQIIAGDGNNSLNVDLSPGRLSGQVYYVGGMGTDTVAMTGTSSTVVYSSALSVIIDNIGNTFDRLAYTGSNAITNTFSAHYTAANVETVTDRVVAGRLEVNGTSGVDTIVLGNATINTTPFSTFSVNGQRTVNFIDKLNVIVGGGQGNSNQTDTINLTGNFLAATNNLTLRNAVTITQTAGTLTAGELTLDSIASVPALNTDIAGLSVVNSGAVSVNEVSGLQLNQITTTGPLTVVAGGNITDNDTVQRNISGVLTLTATGGDILLNAQNQNYLSGAITLIGATVNINNSVATRFGAVNAASFTVNSAGDITQTGAIVAPIADLTAAGSSITLNHPDNDFSNLIINAAAVSVTDINRIDSGSIAAASVTLNTNTGVGTVGAPLATTTSNLTINNTAGDVYASNTGAATVRITTLGNIGFTNNGNLTIDRLYSGGNGFLDRSLYRNVALNVSNGSVQGIQGIPNRTIYDTPDITAFELTAFISGGGGFGTVARPISISVVDTFSYLGGRGYVHYFGARPPNIFDADNLITFSALDALTGLQLLEVESLDEFDPAIFTEVRNYYYEDVAIMMPADQRLDSSDEDEKGEEKEGKL